MHEEEKQAWNVISRYTEADAVDDGTLVPLDRRNLVTRPVWEYFCSHTPMDSKPPNRWPVDMMGWFRAGSIEQGEALKLIAKHGMDAQSKYEQQIRDKKAAALAKGIIGQYEQRARRVYDQNIGGGIFQLFAVEKDSILTSLSEQETGRKLWLIPNDVGGITLMFPEDY